MAPPTPKPLPTSPQKFSPHANATRGIVSAMICPIGTITSTAAIAATAPCTSLRHILTTFSPSVLPFHPTMVAMSVVSSAGSSAVGLHGAASWND
jgi:hypothetical protein